jgi:hypothetical protein
MPLCDANLADKQQSLPGWGGFAVVVKKRAWLDIDPQAKGDVVALDAVHRRG